MRSKLGLLVVLALLAFAFPSVTLLVFETLCMIVGAVFLAAAWVQAHLSLVLFVAAMAVLAYFFPQAFRSFGRWLSRSLVEAVRSVMPEPGTDPAVNRPAPTTVR